jgi:hypothetical protein
VTNCGTVNFSGTTLLNGLPLHIQYDIQQHANHELCCICTYNVCWADEEEDDPSTK